MNRTARYLSHPQVAIRPDVDITRWSLSDIGASRAIALARSGALRGTASIVSSGERKAIETAAPLAASLGLEVEVRERMHENDRSATGYLPPDEFERVADRFFAHPDASVRGWETARAAQRRIVEEVDGCLERSPSGDVLFVGHGGVGTLLLCSLLGVPISRAHDQGPGGGGCYLEFDIATRAVLGEWAPLERLVERNARSGTLP